MKVCVYCGSREPQTNEIKEAAIQLGTTIAQKKWSLVYGGAKVGLMGLLADACLNQQGEVIGVIPTNLKRAEVAHPGISQLHETQDMHTRKALMETLSDAFVVLPGGFGTMDEFFEILTWRQLGLHQKKIILVNINGFYDGMMQFFNHAQTLNLIPPMGALLYHEVQTIEECINLLKSNH